MKQLLIFVDGKSIKRPLRDIKHKDTQNSHKEINPQHRETTQTSRQRKCKQRFIGTPKNDYKLGIGTFFKYLKVFSVASSYVFNLVISRSVYSDGEKQSLLFGIIMFTTLNMDQRKQRRELSEEMREKIKNKHSTGKSFNAL